MAGMENREKKSDESDASSRQDNVTKAAVIRSEGVDPELCDANISVKSNKGGEENREIKKAVDRMKGSRGKKAQENDDEEKVKKSMANNGKQGDVPIVMEVDEASRKRPCPASETSGSSSSPELHKKKVPAVDLNHLNGGQMKKAYKELEGRYAALVAQLQESEKVKKKMQQQLEQQGKLMKQQQQQLKDQGIEIAAVKKELQRLVAIHCQRGEPPISSQSCSGVSGQSRPLPQQTQQQKPQQQRQQQQKLQQQMQQQPQQKPQQQMQQQQKLQQQQPEQQQQLTQKKQTEQASEVQQEEGTSRQTGESWAKVVRKKPKPKKENKAEVPRQSERKEVNLLKRRVPHSSAVILKKRDEKMTYTEIIRKARSSISLAEMGVTVQRSRYTKQGEMLLEVKADDKVKINTFTERLKAVLINDVSVRRPVRTTTLLVLDIEESATIEEIAGALGPEGVRVYGLTTMGRGCQKAKAVVAIDTALHLLKEGRIPIGWSMCRVRSLEKEIQAPPRCFKCLRVGHMAANCKGQPVGAVCYRCSGEGHQIRNCKAEQVKCPVCVQEEGQNSEHVLGSQGCVAMVMAGKKANHQAKKRQLKND